MGESGGVQVERLQGAAEQRVVFEPEQNCRQIGMRFQEGPLRLLVIGLRSIEAVDFV